MAAKEGVYENAPPFFVTTSSSKNNLMQMITQVGHVHSKRSVKLRCGDSYDVAGKYNFLSGP
ncbi:MAG: hypothetical protein CMM80_01530, partial [Rhodospirillaceae bacterium]|nr:hypothetical protein [Rhodospirillaceae bacterium]